MYKRYATYPLSDLDDERWLSLARHIRKRDNLSCRFCGTKGVELHVHHTLYIENKRAWEYPEENLITLCKVCHNNIDHSCVKILKDITHSLQIVVRDRLYKNSKKPNDKLRFNMSGERDDVSKHRQTHMEHNRILELFLDFGIFDYYYCFNNQKKVFMRLSFWKGCCLILYKDGKNYYEDEKELYGSTTTEIITYIIKTYSPYSIDYLSNKIDDEIEKIIDMNERNKNK